MSGVGGVSKSVPDMTYNVFVGTLNLDITSQHSDILAICCTRLRACVIELLCVSCVEL